MAVGQGIQTTICDWLNGAGSSLRPEHIPLKLLLIDINHTSNLFCSTTDDE